MTKAQNMKARTYLVDIDNLPDQWPTNTIPPEFWEELGRVVASFGFLEEILGKAIFSITGFREYDEVTEETFTEWRKQLERALKDPLGGLIKLFEDALENDEAPTFENWRDLISDLREAKVHRDILCHGSWRRGSDPDLFVPFFVKRGPDGPEVFDGEYSVKKLNQVRGFVREVAVQCINSVTLKGIQFPGSNGAGLPVWD